LRAVELFSHKLSGMPPSFLPAHHFVPDSYRIEPFPSMPSGRRPPLLPSPHFHFHPPVPRRLPLPRDPRAPPRGRARGPRVGARAAAGWTLGAGLEQRGRWVWRMLECCRQNGEGPPLRSCVPNVVLLNREHGHHSSISGAFAIPLKQLSIN